MMMMMMMMIIIIIIIMMYFLAFFIPLQNHINYFNNSPKKQIQDM